MTGKKKRGVHMAKERTRYEITSADDKLIATDYQYYFSINTLFRYKARSKKFL